MKLLDYPLMLLARTLLLALYLIALIPAAHWVFWRGGKKGEARYVICTIRQNVRFFLGKLE